MGSVFTMFFAFVTKFFSAAEHVASACDHLGTWADEAAAQFADKARHDRQQALKVMLKEAGITELPKAKAKPVIAATAP